MHQSPSFLRATNLAAAVVAPLKVAEARRAWLYYARLYRGRYGSLVAAVATAMLQSVALLPLPLVVQYLIDQALPARNLRHVVLATGGVFATLVTYAGFGFLSRSCAFRANSAAVCRLRSELLAQVFRFSRDHLIKADHARLHANLVQDSERVVLMVGVLIEQFLPAALTCAALCAFLIYLDTRTTLSLLLALPLFAFIIHRWGRRVRVIVTDFRNESKNFSHGVARLLRSFDLIHQRGTDVQELEEQTGHAERLHEAMLKLSWANASYNFGQSIVIASAMVSVLVLSSVAVVTGRMTLGALLGLYATLVLLRDRLYMMLQTIPVVVKGSESLLAMWQLLQGEDPEPYHGTQRLEFAGNVCFREVNFAYHRGARVAKK